MVLGIFPCLTNRSFAPGGELVLVLPPPPLSSVSSQVPIHGLILDFELSSFKNSFSNFPGQVDSIVSGLLGGCWSHCLSFAFHRLKRRVFFGLIPYLFFFVVLLGLHTRSCTYPCIHIDTPPQARHAE